MMAGEGIKRTSDTVTTMLDVLSSKRRLSAVSSWKQVVQHEQPYSLVPHTQTLLQRGKEGLVNIVQPHTMG